MLGHDPVGHRESKTVPFSGLLGGDEGVEDLLRVLQRDTGARVSDLDLGLALLRFPQLDPLVLETFELALRDLGAPANRRTELGKEYFAAVGRLGIA